MFNDLSSLPAYLSTRRSGKPRDMVAPGPDDATLRTMIGMAARTPDHGKLAPWRFVIVPAEQRTAFAAMLVAAYRADKPEAGRLEIEAIEQFAHQAPTLVVVVSAPNATSHIPLWEQQLSAGAACMNLLHAAHAHGFVGGWLTGWATYSAAVRDSLAEGATIAGFVFIGTPSRALDERPRPDLETIVRYWAE
ncbi:nitroreductase family protein [Sphingomonas qomolangmaensis]|uniref:Putative NAD(P)H nitroreductase n=1 Tax=Sphingomonas qomolangmaensis TaxID=2918765 RepID=A0ABY5L897_9SPHN|nr:nitroreductase [Sphingomonas qomolangmaensis]UUL82672.1 nitroreductase [Sphingomonas qomolangmaensis]